ncbi:XRE family transcriptional regulator [Gordonia jinhuaensis]|uniref:Hypothetical transcriptional regulator n=2 Tax=Gordonia jinhuaensis TaxID=1517702 RepID=A0A916T8H8_9ACTN|nr:hypothetical transcriptional regulator [Gordonia jinhuaensis]
MTHMTTGNRFHGDETDAGPPVADVGSRIRDLRTARGLSLSELARRAHIGKGSLSEIEAGGRNPTLETLYAICAPLQVPLTTLIGGANGVRSTAAGGMTSALLELRELPSMTVEVFWLDFPADADHTSPGHADAVTEHLTVVSGQLAVGPLAAPQTLSVGESTTWRSDGEHRYRAVDGPAQAVLVIMTPRASI